MKYFKRYTLMLICSSSILLGSADWVHAEDAGPMAEFIKEKKALKMILAGQEREVEQRNEALTEESVDWLGQYFNEDLDSGEIHQFFLAKDRQNARLVAVAITAEAPYANGVASLVLGIDAEGHVIRAAVLAVNQKYVLAFETADKKGWLHDMQGIPVTSLIDKGQALEDGKLASVEQTVMVKLKDSAVLLSAFIHQFE